MSYNFNTPIAKYSSSYAALYCRTNCPRKKLLCRTVTISYRTVSVSGRLISGLNTQCGNCSMGNCLSYHKIVKLTFFSRYAMPNGYIAVSDVLEKKSFLKRPRSISYTKGSFESIAEEDEESLEDVKNIRTFMYLTYLSSFFL